MNGIGDFFKGVAEDALKDILNKASRKVTRRTRRRSRPTGSTATLRQIEKLLNPAKKQTSRKRTTKARSKVKRRGW
jgi:hypothetical protein